MKILKKLTSILGAFALVVSSLTITSSAATTANFSLKAEATNGGQNIYQVEIEYQNFKPARVDTDTFSVVASGSSQKYRTPTDQSYGDFTNQQEQLSAQK